eukprot:12764340-Alexandrium_andersonii.AAC.1
MFGIRRHKLSALHTRVGPRCPRRMFVEVHYVCVGCEVRCHGSSGFARGSIERRSKSMCQSAP